MKRAGLLVLGVLAIAGDAGAQDAPRPRVVVRGAGRRDETPAKLEHIQPEVAGTKIAVTKKTDVTKLEQTPTVIGDALREIFTRTPGVQVSEQQTLTRFNLNYRGLGDPQGSQGILVLQDGLPINADWIGSPTLNVFPLSGSLSEVQLVRAGAGLLYGSNGGAAVNLVSARPKPGAPLSGSSEQVVGSDGLYSTFNVLQGARGPLEFRADAGYLETDGQRSNAASRVRQGDFYLGDRPDARSLFYLDLHLYDADAGDPGPLGYAAFKADSGQASTPYNHDWVQRYALTFGADRDLGGGWKLEAKAWTAYQSLSSRLAQPEAAGRLPPASTVLQSQLFRSEGADVRAVYRWGRGNALTLGAVAYHDDAPFQQWTSADLLAGQDDHSGVARLRQVRTSYDGAVFAENVFRLPYRIHIVPSVRLNRDEVDVKATTLAGLFASPLDVKAARNTPLFGLGVGNDFGVQNETYLSITQGYQALRFLDVASPFNSARLGGRTDADPSQSVDYEAGVHGTPIKGLFYDAGLFWVDVRHRMQTVVIDAADLASQVTGDTRHRGLEGEIAYDFLNAAPGGRRLTAFASLSLLDARFTASAITGQVGKVPAFAPHALGKYGVTLRKPDNYSISLTGVSVSAQFFQDSDASIGVGPAYVPAKVPGYTVLDFAGDWTVAQHVRLLGGVSNIGDARYYSQAAQDGLTPALGRTIYGGVAFGF